MERKIIIILSSQLMEIIFNYCSISSFAMGPQGYVFYLWQYSELSLFNSSFHSGYLKNSDMRQSYRCTLECKPVFVFFYKTCIWAVNHQVASSCLNEQFTLSSFSQSNFHFNVISQDYGSFTRLRNKSVKRPAWLPAIRGMSTSAKTGQWSSYSQYLLCNILLVNQRPGIAGE